MGTSRLDSGGSRADGGLHATPHLGEEYFKIGDQPRACRLPNSSSSLSALEIHGRGGSEDQSRRG